MKQKGFTMIELMIVVAIIGILAAIALPKFADMIEKSREGSTKGNAGSIKSANSIYYGDQEGFWPETMESTVAFRYSLYLDMIPEVKATGKFDANTVPLHPGAQKSGPKGKGVTHVAVNIVPDFQWSGWMYDSSTGNTYVCSTLQDSKKIPYSFYGFE
jgi:prepilin-type N-terminal cleavage/methylation domain-containing protein